MLFLDQLEETEIYIRRMQQLVDGKGTQRIVEVLKSYKKEGK